MHESAVAKGEQLRERDGSCPKDNSTDDLREHGVLFRVPGAGGGFFNSALAGLTTFIFISVGLGRRVLERLVLWSTILLIVDRAGLLPIAAWLHRIVAIVDRTLT